MPDEKTGDSGNSENKSGDSGSKVIAKEAWMGSLGLTDAQITGVNEGIGGMHGALSSVKDDRQGLRDELTAIKNANNIEADEKVKQMQAAIDTATSKADFLESLPQEVTNKKLACLAVNADATLLNADGSANVEKLKAAHPQLFAGSLSVDGSAGNGAGGKPPGSKMTGGQAVDWLIKHGR